MPPVISLIGKPDSGKTTLLEKLIPEFKKRGYRIGTIKHHVHEFEMDRPGKDTWRHKQAGAQVVALSSPSGLGIIMDTDHDHTLEELVDRFYYGVDLVIAEGYKRAVTPKIEVFRSAAHSHPLTNRNQTWVAMVCDQVLPHCDLPQFDINDIHNLADFLVDTFIKT